MRSTFMGLETNKRGMFTQQSALHTVGHNISNANTVGYSRQRVNMQASNAFPGVGLNAGTIPGQLGTGVEAGSIQRIRDSFVDQQYRQETNKLGYWESRSKAIAQMEDVLNEPSEYGLAKSLTEFWQSLQDLAVHPENGGARAVVIQRGAAVADSFNYMHNSLRDIQTSLGKEIETSAGEVNSILEQIAELNYQIDVVEPNGYLPNDLYDARDALIDQLSTFFPVEVSYGTAGGNASKLAMGPMTLSIKLKDSTKLVVVNQSSYGKVTTDPSPLVDETQTPPKNNLASGLSIETIDPATGIKSSNAYAYGEFSELGKMRSLMNSYGTSDNKGIYHEMLTKLNTLAKSFMDEINTQHKAGFDPADSGLDFFTGSGAGDITVAITDPSKVAASTVEGEEGNGKNAKALADKISTSIGTLQEIIGQLGVDGQQAERLRYNTETLLGAVEHRRASISSVSLDEEMTDMIKFQQAYNASARMITVIDETLDRIINGMGRVGM